MLIPRGHPPREADSAVLGEGFRNLHFKQMPIDLAESMDPTLRSSGLDGELILGRGST